MASVRQQQQQQSVVGGASKDIQVRHLASLTSGFGQLTPDEGLQRLRQMESSGGTQCKLRLLGSGPGAGLRVIDPASGQVMEDFPLRSLRQPLAYEGGRDNMLMFSVQTDSGAWEMHIFQLPAAIQASLIAKELHQLIGLGSGGGGSGEAKDPGLLVQVLNRCLEEIESFAVRLQQQLAQQQQQQQQRPSTPRSQRSDRQSARQPANPPAAAAAALPSNDEFVDILKKLKLALNLLGRLEGQIHQPNAPELVHCLFVPLGLIVQTIGSDLPSRVLSPLLTPNSVALLKHCLTSKESELWFSLGSAWTSSRQQWLDQHPQQPPASVPDVPPFRPRFGRDGWQPDLEPELLGQGLSKPAVPAAPPVTNGSGGGGGGGGLAPRQQPQGPFIKVINPVAVSQQYSPYQQNGARSQQQQQQQPQRPIAQVAPRAPLAPPPLAPPPQQQHYPLLVPTAASAAVRRSFHGGGGSYGGSWDERQERLRADAASRGHRVAQAVHDKAGRNAKELTVQRGELLEVLDDSRNWWQLRNCVGEVGHAPYTILRLL